MTIETEPTELPNPMILIPTLIAAGIAAGAITYVKHTNKPAAAKIQAAEDKIAAVAKTEGAKIEQTVVAEIKAVETLAKAAAKRLASLHSTGHVAATQVQNVAAATDHLASTIGNVNGGVTQQP